MTVKDDDAPRPIHEHPGIANDQSPIDVLGADEDVDEERPGEWSPEGMSQLRPDYIDTPRVPKEYRDAESFAQPDRDMRTVRGNEGNEGHHLEVAEVVGTTGLACGIGETDYPCGVMDDEDPDSSGGASDIDEGF